MAALYLCSRRPVLPALCCLASCLLCLFLLDHTWIRLPWTSDPHSHVQQDHAASTRPHTLAPAPREDDAAAAAARKVFVSKHSAPVTVPDMALSNNRISHRVSADPVQGTPRRSAITHRNTRKHKHGKSLPFNHPYWCNVSCSVGKPCEYKDEVDFRIMVLTYERPFSLQTCLNHILLLETLGDYISVEIWVDRSVVGEVNHSTLEVARTFQSRWQGDRRRRACVHVQERNAGIAGQWTDTWRPKAHTKEMGLFVEDDVDISPWAYKWLKAVHAHYGSRTDITGYTLQMQNVHFFAGEQGAMYGPYKDTVFMYGVLGTWGFSPHPGNWRIYQDWSHRVRRDRTQKPYVEGIKPTEWYKTFEASGEEEHMWEMWHIYFAYKYQLYCVYSNLLAHTGLNQVLLSWNRMEPGLHFVGQEALMESDELLTHWQDSFVQFPRKTVQFYYNGTIAQRV